MMDEERQELDFVAEPAASLFVGSEQVQPPLYIQELRQEKDEHWIVLFTDDSKLTIDAKRNLCLYYCPLMASSLQPCSWQVISETDRRTGEKSREQESILFH